MSADDLRSSRQVFYGRYLLFLAGMGGLLYGIDVGIISGALLYLGKTVDLTVGQTSAVVAAVLGGSMLSSLIAGFLADWFGRRKMMIFSGLLFLASVVLIVASHAFVSLFLGRLLQGMSGGVIAVVVPLYLAECLSAETRGRGSAIFQFMLTFGIVIAALTGYFYIHQAEAAILSAHGDAVLIRAAEDHAWRGMFLSVIYPGAIFFVGSFFLSETPRWLYQKGRTEQAYEALRRSSTVSEARAEMQQMQTLAGETKQRAEQGRSTLLQRKFVYPFVLACAVLALNQGTGINSVLGYLAIILRQSGMSPDHATQGDLAVKILNCVMTILAVALIDRKGRKFLLTIGTAGIVISLLCAASVLYGFEAHRQDMRDRVQAAVRGNQLQLAGGAIAILSATQQPGTIPHTGPQGLTVLYRFGSGGDKLATLVQGDSMLNITPDTTERGLPLTVEHAYLAPIPQERTGWIIAACFGLFIAAYSVGPGVVVWLTLSELMPMRIRSAGMGIALLLNQGVSTLIAGVFLPVVSRYGYYAMFLAWAASTALYFLTAVFFLPETKGKTLEEIELGFESA